MDKILFECQKDKDKFWVALGDGPDKVNAFVNFIIKHHDHRDQIRVTNWITAEPKGV